MQLASWRLLARTIKNVDVVIEVVDIRDPMVTRSRRAERMAEALDKSLLIVLNKSDLVPLRVAEKWARIIEGMGFDVIYVSARHRLSTRRLRGYIKHLADVKPFSAGVIGFPKTGKSSVINALRGRKGAPTSPIPGSPGYTKGLQLLKIEPGFYMVDTPGVIPVEGGWPESIIRGRSPEDLADPVPPAAALIEKILRYNRRAFQTAYGISAQDPYEIMERLAIKRGWFYKTTKEPLIEEAARTIIRDYHKAKIPFYVPPEEFTG
ncbi:GTPase [Aeropyrum camini]|uniref:GTP-binding protein n=1 Tax=Aeropyrum camini SY1 = JCM 12091 TaxID=1198449 RepID=U3TBY2_9CREN|nr:GTPase [Aeropyrum camini]BAN89550.1 GTP-binding protein [Aeropyrum camini SY1 = JCM 12091]